MPDQTHKEPHAWPASVVLDGDFFRIAGYNPDTGAFDRPSRSLCVKIQQRGNVIYYMLFHADGTRTIRSAVTDNMKVYTVGKVTLDCEGWQEGPVVQVPQHGKQPIRCYSLDMPEPTPVPE